MSKTIFSVLAIVAAIAVNVIPGAGQAISATIFSATVGSVGLAAAATIANVVGFAITAGITVAGITSAESLFGPKPQKPSSTETNVKVPNPARTLSLGRRRLYPAYIFYQTGQDGVAGDAYAVHDCPVGPIDGYEGFYLGDDRVANGPGVVQGLKDGTYTDGKVEIDCRTGLRAETPYGQLEGLFPGMWTAAHRGDAVATAIVTWQPVKSKNYSKYYPKGQPALSAVARWSRVYDWRDPSQSLTDPLTWKWSENAVLGYVFYKLVCDGRTPTLAVDDAGFAGQLAEILQDKWSRWFEPTLSYWTAAADDADSAVPITSFRTVLSADDSSDSNHTILIANTYGLAVGMEITISALDDINHTETVTVTSISGNTVGISPEVAYFHGQGSTVTWQSSDAHPLSEARYRTCAAWEMTTPHKSNLAAILACFDGWVAPREDGALVVYSGRYYEPTVTIGPDQIVAFNIADGIEDESACNELVLTSISAEHDYSTPECEPWRDQDDIDSRGRVASQTLENQVPSYTQARRLAKRAMARIMAPKTFTITTNPAGRIADGHRFINLVIAEGGSTWFAGPVEITALKHQQTGLSISAVSADPNIDEWNPATEEGLPAPVGNTVAVEPLTTPEILTAAANFGADSADGSAGAFVRLQVSAPDRDDLTWFARTRIQGAAVWGERTYTDLDPGTSVQIDTEFVPTDAMIEVEVAYQVSDGRVSDWSDTATVDTSTAALATAAPTEFSATGGTGSVVIAWRNPNDAKFSFTRIYRGLTVNFATASAIEDVPGGLGAAGTYTDTVSPGTYYYWVRAFTSANVGSTTVGPINASAS